MYLYMPWPHTGGNLYIGSQGSMKDSLGGHYIWEIYASFNVILSRGSHVPCATRSFDLNERSRITHEIQFGATS